MIVAIFVAEKNRGAQRRVPEIEVVAGKGIVGDRNFGKSQWAGQNLTLVEAEEITRFNEEQGKDIPLSATRRNLVTEGVRLNDLVGKTFRIGDVRVRGVRLCEPCATLGDDLAHGLMTRAVVVEILTHRAGLRADVLTDGVIAEGMTLDVD
jgi:MOSC domain-containing protein YiiM